MGISPFSLNRILEGQTRVLTSYRYAEFDPERLCYGRYMNRYFKVGKANDKLNPESLEGIEELTQSSVNRIKTLNTEADLK